MKDLIFFSLQTKFKIIKGHALGDFYYRIPETEDKMSSIRDVHPCKFMCFWSKSSFCIKLSKKHIIGDFGCVTTSKKISFSNNTDSAMVLFLHTFDVINVITLMKLKR